MKSSNRQNKMYNDTPLFHLGWNNDFENLLRQVDSATGHIGRVISANRNLFTISDGITETLCSPAGKLLHRGTADYPVTGDWVLVNDSVISAVLPRKNMLSRAEAGSRGSRNPSTTREQPIAANIDTVFIVCGLDRDYNPRRLERYLTLVYNCGMNPLIVLTKADLHEDPAHFKDEVETIAFGVPVVLTSPQDKSGIDELEQHLGSGQTAAMIGSSGAGKSTLANMLCGKELQTTGAVSQSVGKGCHTTTTRELIQLPQGGLLMDNPGIREIAFHEDRKGIGASFADISAFAENCRFSDCTHRQEPGCAVIRAVKNNELSPERLAAFHKLQQEMDYLTARSSKSSERIEKERWREISKLQKTLKNTAKRG